MTEAQFAKAHEKMLREHSALQFQRMDWNGDGVLSLDEFRAPLRARFEKMDRDGSGTIACKPGTRPAAPVQDATGRARSTGRAA